MHERAVRAHVMSEPSAPARGRRARGPYSILLYSDFPSLAAAELAADFTFCHRSSDQDYLKIVTNNVDGLVTSPNSWNRKLGAFRDLVPVFAGSVLNPYHKTDSTSPERYGRTRVRPYRTAVPVPG